MNFLQNINLGIELKIKTSRTEQPHFRLAADKTRISSVLLVLIFSSIPKLVVATAVHKRRPQPGGEGLSIVDKGSGSSNANVQVFGCKKA